MLQVTTPCVYSPHVLIYEIRNVYSYIDPELENNPTPLHSLSHLTFFRIHRSFFLIRSLNTPSVDFCIKNNIAQK